MAAPNALLTYVLGHILEPSANDQELASNAFTIWAAFTSVLFFVLSFRSNVAYNRWWEGGTLLQQTRGEWFNAYSSLIAFTSTDPSRESEVEAYQHMLARLMSLLFCSALQQVSPSRDRPFDIIDSAGIDPLSLDFLFQSSDRVEVIIQWIQRATILNMSSGVLPVAPPVMSRAFQEMSRGIVNLQNARKIADFPFPYPYAQMSIVMLIIHWLMCPILATMLLEKSLATATCFVVVFFMWGLHFIALQLESPFGKEDNDLPMEQMQAEWNQSVATLLAKKASTPPAFAFVPGIHREMDLSAYPPKGRPANIPRRRQSLSLTKELWPTGGSDCSQKEVLPDEVGRQISDSTCSASSSQDPRPKPSRASVVQDADHPPGCGTVGRERSHESAPMPSIVGGGSASSSSSPALPGRSNPRPRSTNRSTCAATVHEEPPNIADAVVGSADGLPKIAAQETLADSIHDQDVNLRGRYSAGGSHSSSSCSTVLAAALSLLPASTISGCAPPRGRSRGSQSRRGLNTKAQSTSI